MVVAATHNSLARWGVDNAVARLGLEAHGPRPLDASTVKCHSQQLSQIMVVMQFVMKLVLWQRGVTIILEARTCRFEISATLVWGWQPHKCEALANHMPAHMPRHVVW